MWRLTFFTLISVAISGSVQAALPLPGGGEVEKVDFERHIMGMFGKLGCNGGSCHGSFQGKNGFRLSLFGYDPEKDFLALTREIHARRIDRIHPEESLLLTKSTGTVLHEGGIRFSRDSWQYQIFREWIKQGATWEKGSGQIAKIEMQPKEFISVKPGHTTQVQIFATFADGSKENITPFCDFRTMDDAVAVTTPLGKITALRPGDSGFVVSYRGTVQAARILVPATLAKGQTYPQIEATNYIDREIQKKLKTLNMIPSDKATDLEFLRRVYLDTIGRLPEPTEIREFLKDQSSNKRENKIDELLKHPLHSALWATKLSDITGNNTEALENPQNQKVVRSQQWHDWLRKRLHENMPYDQIVEGIMLATSLDGQSGEEWLKDVRKIDEDAGKGFNTEEYSQRKTLDLFWRRQQRVPSDIWGQKVAAAFLGVRLECAECHKHPTDRWTQTDYRSFANIFSQVTLGIGSTPDVRKVITAENDERKAKYEGKNNNNLNLVKELFVIATPNPREVMEHPETKKPLNPKLLGGAELTYRKGEDLRAEVMKWMRSPENTFFARSFANRVWGHYLGLGLVDPVDDFSLANPPSNAALLDALAKEFIRLNFDIRALEKQILMSRTYQTSAKPNATNKFDRNNYSRYYVRSMIAEVVLDTLNSSLGVPEKFGGEIPNDKPRAMIEIGSSRIQNPTLSYLLRIFGRPPRSTACDCERAMEPALPQTLFLMTDEGLGLKMRDKNNRLNRLLTSEKDDLKVLDELFLATLTRLPTKSDQEAFLAYKAKGKDRVTTMTDTLWSLINTREFILNH
jgi:hypothetical protein